MEVGAEMRLEMEARLRYRYRAPLLVPDESESPCSLRVSWYMCLKPLRAALPWCLSGAADGIVCRETSWITRMANVTVWTRACA